MGHIPEEVIEEIKRRADIVDVIGQYVSLKKAGNAYKGMCPFHNDKDPSMNVRPEFGTYKCFGCGASGTVFTFLMEKNGLTFPEAVEELGSRYGVEVPRVEGQGGPSKSERELLYEANNEAQVLFRRSLEMAGEDSVPTKYLRENRKLTPETIKRFGLGFAPDSWDAMVQHMRKVDLSPDRAENVGLLGKREVKGGFFDKFRNRIMCPIIDLRDRLVGFSGRTLGEDRAKYMNSTESPIFNKSETFYALNLARDTIRKTGTAIVVEGNFDVIRMHQEGITGSVAALGTAFTQDHARLLMRLSERVVLLLDGDASGKKAAFRAMEIFLAEDFEPDLVVLKDGDDPDTFIDKYGAKALTEMIENARPALEMFIQTQIQQAGDQVQGKTRAVANVAKVLSRIDNPTRSTLYSQQLADKIGVSQDVVAQAVRSTRVDLVKHAPTSWKERVNGEQPKCERLAIQLALRFPEKVLPVLPTDIIELISDTQLQNILEKCQAEYIHSQTITTPELIGKFDDTGIEPMVSDLVMTDPGVDETILDRTIHDCFQRIRKDAGLRARKRLLVSLADAEKQGDRDKAMRLKQELSSMIR